MAETQIHHWLVLLVFAMAALSFVALLWVNAPYGRFFRAGWGPTMSARNAWVVFESPAVIIFVAVFFLGDHSLQATPLVLLGLWQWHYVMRAFVFPFRLRESGKRIPLLIVAMAILFNVLNAYINARWISHLGEYPQSWLTSAAFIGGAAMFLAGWLINQRADLTLIRLRRSNDSGYQVPHGGLYRWVSCPNYLGEIIMWVGWAIATWSLAGTAFAVFTLANLLPRALANHRWYQASFQDYPATRRAIIPFLV